MSERQEQERYVPAKRSDQLLEVLRKRRAVRGFTDRDVEREKIEKILEAGRWAPSGANSQPWEFVVVTDDETTTAIGDIYVEFYDEYYDPDFPVDNKRWHKEAPTYIVPIGDMRLKNAYPRVHDGEEAERWTRIIREEVFQHSLASAIYAMWLMAATLGLGTNSASCFEYHKQRLRELLAIPEVYDIPATMPIGYPLEYQQTQYRQPLNDLTHEGSYDESLYREEDEIVSFVKRIRGSRYRGDGELLPEDSPAITDDPWG